MDKSDHPKAREPNGHSYVNVEIPDLLGNAPQTHFVSVLLGIGAGRVVAYDYPAGHAPVPLGSSFWPCKYLEPLPRCAGHRHRGRLTLAILQM